MRFRPRMRVITFVALFFFGLFVSIATVSTLIAPTYIVWAIIAFLLFAITGIIAMITGIWEDELEIDQDEAGVQSGRDD